MVEKSMSNSTQSALSPEFAVSIRETLLVWAARELETTKKVLAAIPDAKSDYRPDPSARTAWELAWHIANTDVQFLDGIGDLKFSMKSPSEADKPKNVADLVAWYDTNLRRGVAGVQALSAE